MLLTVDDVADMLQISVRRVYQLPIKRTALGPRTTRFHPDDVISYIERLRGPQVKRSRDARIG